MPARPAAPQQNDPYAAEREAFLAAERARTAAAAASGDDDYGYSAAAARRQSSPTAGYVFGDPRKRSLLMAYFFWYFCGAFAIHRFYCGHKESAIYQVSLFFGGMVVLFIWPPLGMVGLGAWLLWLLADMFLIPGMMRRFKAAHEEDLAERFA